MENVPRLKVDLIWLRQKYTALSDERDILIINATIDDPSLISISSALRHLRYRLPNSPPNTQHSVPIRRRHSVIALLHVPSATIKLEIGKQIVYRFTRYFADINKVN